MATAGTRFACKTGISELRFSLFGNSMVYGTLDGLQPIDTLSKNSSSGTIKEKWPYDTYIWLQSPTTNHSPSESLLHKHILQQLIPTRDESYVGIKAAKIYRGQDIPVICMSALYVCGVFRKRLAVPLFALESLFLHIDFRTSID